DGAAGGVGPVAAGGDGVAGAVVAAGVGGGVAATVEAQAAAGRRVVLVARAERLAGEALPADLVPVAVVVLEEQVRAEAADTIDYFCRQGVELRVISGDNPATVGAVARRVGVPGAEDPYDARRLPTGGDELAEVLAGRTVYGRVTPQQKQAMVGALQARGHVVAMTGDGVNDVLALKDADLGIAMGNGTAATRAVARVVLLDGSFASLPAVVAEGRRVITNIERVANLFLTKTIYAVVFAVVTGALAVTYPFLPRHLTLVSAFAIGIPGFFLALAPARRRARPGFEGRVLRFVLVSGPLVAITVLATYGWTRLADDATQLESQTAATIVLLGMSLMILLEVARPLTAARVVLVAAMAACASLAIVVPAARDFFALDVPGPATWAAIVVALAAGAAAIALLVRGRLLLEAGEAAAPGAGGATTPAPRPGGAR
ncbi:MAG: HAD-IC family P-type ATPase, partial [Acidimicrobiia bacterium]|nr:HAD-IC family P-type ATPase [Acidimicrobiia bacterium]